MGDILNSRPSQARVLVGDCRELMRSMADASVDAIVTDPPYELGFMGKKWDASGIAYDLDVWREALRVLKPGGHLLAFGGTRTYHRMTCAIEDAGFEVRDSIHWIYGSGFPKSLDVSKAIDKMDAAEEQLARRFRFTEWVRSTGATSRQIDEVTGTNMGGHYTTAASQPAIMTREHLEACRGLLGDVPEWVEREAHIRSVESQNMARREVVAVRKNWGAASETTPNAPNGLIVDSLPATDAAKAWHGWGTALKPAHEPIVVARKPLVGTVAANVLEHGTGAINVDACRVGEPLGRWPANIVLVHSPDCGDECAEDCAVAEMDRQSGDSRSTKGKPRGSAKAGDGWGMTKTGAEYDDAGGASRFFPCFRYQAKASKRDRGDGNTHPTVKPVELMRWLVRLVTPPGGLVLDPFTGSGTTGVACAREGFDFVGLELLDNHADIARRRIEAAQTELPAQMALDVVGSDNG